MEKRWVGFGILLSLVLLFGLLSSPVSAFETRSGEVVVIGPDEVVPDDLYVGAQSLLVDGVIEGDLFFGGQQVIVRGTVTGDVWLAGQELTVSGEVGDDCYMAGAALKLGPRARIGDDLWAAGYSLEASPGSLIQGALQYGGYQLLLASDVEEDANIGTAAMVLEGRIQGDVDLDVGSSSDRMFFDPTMFWTDMPTIPSVSPGLRFGEGAQIGGDLQYRSGESIPGIERVVQGSVTHIETMDRDTDDGEGYLVLGWLGRWIRRSLRRFLVLIIVGLLIAALLPGWLIRLGDELQNDPGPSVGWGALTYFLLPLALFILAIILIVMTILLSLIWLGPLVTPLLVIGLALILICGVVFGFTVTFITKIIVGYLLGRYILGTQKVDREAQPIIATLIGTAIVGILTAIPVLGWLLSLVIALFGLGAIWLWGEDLLSPHEESDVAEPV
jgi:cytoskeletal protein CcmA (bactofilin family)